MKFNIPEIVKGKPVPAAFCYREDRVWGGYPVQLV